MADEAHTALTLCAARRHTRTWHAAFLASITCRMPMEKTAVLPVPDCDCTIRSRPRISGPMARACTALGRCKEEDEEGGGKEASWREEAGRGGSGLARRQPPQARCAAHMATHRARRRTSNPCAKMPRKRPSFRPMASKVGHTVTSPPSPSPTLSKMTPDSSLSAAAAALDREPAPAPAPAAADDDMPGRAPMQQAPVERATTTRKRLYVSRGDVK